jgi:hypothetical protein
MRYFFIFLCAFPKPISPPITFFLAFPGNIEFVPFVFLVIGAIGLFQKGKYDKMGGLAFEWNSRDASTKN